MMGQRTGQLGVQRADDTDDPVLASFLDFLARDIATHPRRVHAIDAGLGNRMRKLVKGVKVELEAPLDPDAE